MAQIMFPKEQAKVDRGSPGKAGFGQKLGAVIGGAAGLVTGGPVGAVKGAASGAGGCVGGANLQGLRVYYVDRVGRIKKTTGDYVSTV